MGSDPQHIRRRPEGALFRTYLQAAGVAPESFGKPLIGVATCSSQLFSERSWISELSEIAVTSVELKGGLAVRWETTRSPDLMSWGHAEGYSFAWRDQLADLIESWVRQETLDGLILIADAPESLIGMAMSAVRVNIPAVMIPLTSATFEPKDEGFGDSSKKRKLRDPYRLLSEVLFGKKGADESLAKDAFSDVLLAGDEHEASAVSFALEALGLCFPGMATTSVRSSRLRELVEQSASRVMDLIESGVSVRRILTMNAFMNSLRANAALGGSIDAAIHLMALAHENDVPLTIDSLDQVARQTSQLANLGGVSEKSPSSLDEFDRAGGVWALLHGLRSSVLPNNTVFGKGAAELAKVNEIKDSRVICESRPFKKTSGIGVLKGNVATNGALFLLNQVHKNLRFFTGLIKVFDHEIDAAKAVADGLIKKGTAIVVKCQGPKGGPGLRKLRILPALLESRGLQSEIPVVTDGRLPDTPQGLFISCVSPEGATRSVFGTLRDHDHLEIDIESRKIEARLTQTDIQVRLARWQAPEVQNHRGFLTRYAKSVSEITDGAILR